MQAVNKVTQTVIGSAIEVHRALGPGLLESAYEECLCHELQLRGMAYARQLLLPVAYKGKQIDYSYRLDLLVDAQVVVELKAIDQVLPIHMAQLLTYLRLGSWQVGLLINFNVELLKHGMTRLVHNLPDSASSAPLR